ncbi:hypothetical protein ACFOSE_00665, partial [Streptococcus dentapri]
MIKSNFFKITDFCPTLCFLSFKQINQLFLPKDLIYQRSTWPRLARFYILLVLNLVESLCDVHKKDALASQTEDKLLFGGLSFLVSLIFKMKNG